MVLPRAEGLAASSLSGRARPLVKQQQAQCRASRLPASQHRRVTGRDWRQQRRQRRCPLPPLVSSSSVAAAAAAGDGIGQLAVTPPQKQQEGPVSAWRQWWHLEAPLLGGDAAVTTDATAPQNMRAILSKVGALLAPDRATMVAAVAFMLAAAACELAIPHFVTAAVFSAAKERSEAAFRHNLSILMATTAGYAGFAAIRGWLFSLVNTNMLQRLRSQLFGRLIRQPVAFFDSTETAQLTSRLAADCSVISRLFSTSINVAIRNALQVIGGAMYLWRLSPQMTAATAGVGAALVGVAAVYGAFTRRAQRVYQDSLAGSNTVAEEGFSLSRIIRAFGTEGEQQARYDASLGTLRRISIRQGVAYAMYVVSNNFLYNATRLATLAVGGAMALGGAATAEQLTAFCFYSEFLASALLSVCDQWGPIMEGVGASERVLAYLEAPPAPQIAAGKVPDADAMLAEATASAPAQEERRQGGWFRGRGASQGGNSQPAPAAGEEASSSSGSRFRWDLDLRDVEFCYPSRPDAKALDGVTLHIPAGKLTALVGLSGSGKSTLVALVQRLYDPSAGSVLVGGVDLRELDAAWFRRRVGVVSQDPRLFGLTVAENIAYGCPDATQEDVERAAALANAHDFIAALPQGYATPVTDKLLSGGQRQRIAIARALVRDPPLLILDEATSALDAESEAAVQAALDRAMRGDKRTVIVIAHRLSTVRHADQTVVMDKGRVAEVGTHSQLMRRGGIYAALVRRQSGAVLDQERDLAPHEAQVKSSSAAGSGEHAPQADGEGGSAPDSLAADDQALPDSLPQWKQAQRLKAEHDPA